MQKGSNGDGNDGDGDDDDVVVFISPQVTEKLLILDEDDEDDEVMKVMRSYEHHDADPGLPPQASTAAVAQKRPHPSSMRRQWSQAGEMIKQ
jgi:hypothetical protein